MFKDINIQRLIHGAGAKACDYKHDRLWVRFPLEEMKYKYFLFLRFGVEAKRGVRFHHSKWGTEVT